MKRRIGKNVVNACVAGLMLGSVGAVGAVAPDSAFAAASSSGEASAEMAMEDVNVCLYGPPSVFQDEKPAPSDEYAQVLYGPPPLVDEPIQDLYGPPPIVIDDPVDVIVDEPIVCLYGPPSVFLGQKNPMKVNASNIVVKAKKVIAKKKVFKGVIVVKKAVGDISYKRVAKESSKQLKVNANSGAITVVKGTKKGRYQIKVKVHASGNDDYRTGNKIVTVKVRVK